MAKIIYLADYLLRVDNSKQLFIDEVEIDYIPCKEYYIARTKSSWFDKNNYPSKWPNCEANLPDESCKILIPKLVEIYKTSILGNFDLDNFKKMLELCKPYLVLCTVKIIQLENKPSGVGFYCDLFHEELPEELIPQFDIPVMKNGIIMLALQNVLNEIKS